MRGYRETIVSAVLFAGCVTTQAQTANDSVKGFKDQEFGEITVTAVKRRGTANAALLEVRNNANVVSAVSAQEISLTQDANAGEVVRRVPGVSVIDGKFVMVRGLSQRYNNVWMNGGAVPSSEADQRAFSFDMIPGGQIDNLTPVEERA